MSPSPNYTIFQPDPCKEKTLQRLTTPAPCIGSSSLDPQRLAFLFNISHSIITIKKNHFFLTMHARCTDMYVIHGSARWSFIIDIMQSQISIPWFSIMVIIFFSGWQELSYPSTINNCQFCQVSLNPSATSASYIYLFWTWFRASTPSVKFNPKWKT